MCSIKFCELYTDDGLVFKIQIYSVTKFTDTESLGQTGSIVLHLMQSYQNNSCHLFTENWYISVSFTEYMSKINTYITETLYTVQKRNPSQVVGKKLRKGEMVFMSLGDISVTKQKDKRVVCVIRNAHVPTMMDSVNRHGQTLIQTNQTLFVSTTTMCRETID